jgi:8-oxo-dGTP diphosphatase
VSDVFVLYGYRHKNIGTELLRLVETQAKANGIQNISLTSASKDSEAIRRFYQRNGYDIWTTHFYKRFDWQVHCYPLDTFKQYRFTVIFARHGSEWLYARHKKRCTYETPGGHVELGETPLECAKRELYEETGAVKFFIHPAFDYSAHKDTEFSYGQVFYADVETLGDLPESEMAEVREFHTIPDEMTYPQILPVLYNELGKWLGQDKAETEFWDVLDADRHLTGRKHRRSDNMQQGEYPLVVRAWIVNRKGEFLITRRAFNKIGFPGLWEVPGGSAVAGEDSLTATIREIKEECGITLLPENAELFSTYQCGNGIFDNWLFRQDFDLSNVVLQEGETIDVRAATCAEIAAMMRHGGFIRRDVFPEFNLLEKSEEFFTT